MGDPTSATRPTPARRLGWLEIAAFCALAFALIGSRIVRHHGTAVASDSYQYMEVARQLHAGHGAVSRFVHFDIERAHHLMPVPVTTFPPGFPWLVATLMGLGLSVLAAAGTVSALSGVLTIAVGGVVARIMNLSPWAGRALLALLAFNATLIVHAAYVMSEASFAALTFIALAAAIAAEQAFAAGLERRGRWQLLLAALVAGLSIWVRYAGALLALALVARHALALAAGRTGGKATGRGPLATRVAVAAVGLLFLGATFVRNTALAGKVRGGNTKVISHPLGLIVRECTAIFHHALLGAEFRLALPLGVLWLAAIVLLFGGQLRGKTRSWLARPGVFLVALFVIIYGAAIVYLAKTTVISRGTRLFLPVVPPIALLLVAWLDSTPAGTAPARSPLRRCGVWVLVLGGWIALNIVPLLRLPGPPPHERIRSALRRPDASGAPLQDWIDREVPADAVVVSPAGQALGFAIDRPTVSLLENEYSDASWTEENVQALMQAFHSRTLFLYPGADVTRVPAAVQDESPFLRDVLAGHPPPWLVPAAANGAVAIYRTTPPR